jgi:predicted Zn-ribbon and HTH transcriptional regulator
MKNTIYAAIIVVCILVAVVVFIKTRSGNDAGIESIAETEQTWVKCMKCNASYEMGMRQYYKELEEKARANPTPMPIAHPLTCQKCGQDAVRKAVKCEKCGNIFFESSIPGDLADRCPQCKHSAIEAKRKANLARQQGEQ